MALQADANWHGESCRALLNPLVEDRNGWFGVRLLQVLEQTRAAEDLAQRAQRSACTWHIAAPQSYIPAGHFFRKDSHLNPQPPLLRIGGSDRYDLRAW